MANEIVVQNSPVTTRLMSVDDAIAEGAMALFGEKYGDEVRVVSMGTALHGDKAGKPYSVELCGGTHVRAHRRYRPGARRVGESAVAAGVRRIEALTGEAARRHLDEQDQRLKAVAATLKVAPADVLARVEALLDERTQARARTGRGAQEAGAGRRRGCRPAATRPRRSPASASSARSVTGVAPKDLKPLADEGKKSLGSGVVVFVGAGDDGKASVVVGVTDDLTERFSAVDLVRAASAALGGQGGGGRPDMAQAGGPDASKAADAIAAVKAAMAGG